MECREALQLGAQAGVVDVFGQPFDYGGERVELVRAIAGLVAHLPVGEASGGDGLARQLDQRARSKYR